MSLERPWACGWAGQEQKSGGKGRDWGRARGGGATGRGSPAPAGLCTQCPWPSGVQEGGPLPSPLCPRRRPGHRGPGAWRAARPLCSSLHLDSPLAGQKERERWGGGLGPTRGGLRPGPAPPLWAGPVLTRTQPGRWAGPLCCGRGFRPASPAPGGGLGQGTALNAPGGGTEEGLAVSAPAPAPHTEGPGSQTGPRATPERVGEERARAGAGGGSDFIFLPPWDFHSERCAGVRTPVLPALSARPWSVRPPDAPSGHSAAPRRAPRRASSAGRIGGACTPRSACTLLRPIDRAGGVCRAWPTPHCPQAQWASAHLPIGTSQHPLAPPPPFLQAGCSPGRSRATVPAPEHTMARGVKTMPSPERSKGPESHFESPCSRSRPVRTPLPSEDAGHPDPRAETLCAGQAGPGCTRPPGGTWKRLHQAWAALPAPPARERGLVGWSTLVQGAGLGEGASGLAFKNFSWFPLKHLPFGRQRRGGRRDLQKAGLLAGSPRGGRLPHAHPRLWQGFFFLLLTRSLQVKIKPRQPQEKNSSLF